MKTESNWEDNSLWQGAARSAHAKEKRDAEIRAMIVEHITKLRVALQQDFNLSDQDILAYIQELLP